MLVCFFFFIKSQVQLFVLKNFKKAIVYKDREHVYQHFVPQVRLDEDELSTIRDKCQHL